MTLPVLEGIRAEAAAHGEPLSRAVRHHLMNAVVERIARSDHASSFVLRGGLLTRAWVRPAPRPTRDLDYVGDFGFDVVDTQQRLASALALSLDDEVVFDPTRLHAEGIWLDSAFPGVRVTLALGLGLVDQQLAMDIGFRDPLVPEPVWLEAPWRVRVRAVRPETQLAWKLHALAEMGPSFRPKDVADVWLIATRVALDDAALVPAIVAAFESRGYTLDQARAVLGAPHWATKTARVRWGTQRPGGPPLPGVLDDIRARLASALKELPA